MAIIFLKRKGENKLAEQKTSMAPIQVERREVVIRGVTYRLTSSFEGLKDLDKTVKRLAVKHATKPLNEK